MDLTAFKSSTRHATRAFHVQIPVLVAVRADAGIGSSASGDGGGVCYLGQRIMHLPPIGISVCAGGGGGCGGYETLSICALPLHTDSAEGGDSGGGGGGGVTAWPSTATARPSAAAAAAAWCEAAGVAAATAPVGAAGGSSGGGGVAPSMRMRAVYDLLDGAYG
jgi:hypothetical protein